MQRNLRNHNHISSSGVYQINKSEHTTISGHSSKTCHYSNLIKGLSETLNIRYYCMTQAMLAVSDSLYGSSITEKSCPDTSLTVRDKSVTSHQAT